MCLEFASCFGGRTDDYGGERPNRREEHEGGRRARGRDRRGNHWSAYNGGAAGHKPAYHHQPPTTVDGAGHKAYHDGGRKGDHTGAGCRGGHAAYAQHKADIETPKLPLWHKVGDEVYTARVQEAADADHRNNAAMYYHHYPTSTTSTTTTLGRY